MTGTLVFDPLLPWLVLYAATGLAVLGIVVALWRGLAGWWLRGLTAAVLLLAIANPSLQEEDRAPLSDIVLAVVDDSASQRIGDRPSQTAAALAAVEAEVAAGTDALKRGSARRMSCTGLSGRGESGGREEAIGGRAGR